MTNYKQERNTDKWLSFVAGYKKAKLTYESQDFEYTEEKLLND